MYKASFSESDLVLDFVFPLHRGLMQPIKFLKILLVYVLTYIASGLLVPEVRMNRFWFLYHKLTLSKCPFLSDFKNV